MANDTMVTPPDVGGEFGTETHELRDAERAMVDTPSDVGPSLADQLAEIATAAKEDAGAPFTPEALALQARVRLDDPAGWARHRQALKKANRTIDLFELDQRLRAIPSAGFDCDDASDDGDEKTRGRTPLWKKWVKALAVDNARLLWTDTKEAYIQLTTGEVLPVRSDDAALWLQARTDPEAFYGSDKWSKAAGALRSYCGQHGERATVYHQSRADFAGGVIYVGCDDGRSMFRVTPEGVDRVPNGSDGILVLNGFAPPLDPGKIEPTGELARWLENDTWATPIARLKLAIAAPMIGLGAPAFAARPLIAAIGHKGSGKTTTMQQYGAAITGRRVIAQALKPEERENEARLVNEHFCTFDNVDAPPRGVPVSDFLATAATQDVVAFRKMRSEGEIIEKPITAFVAVTSFTIASCLRRSDVMDRAIIGEFDRPETGKVREASGRAPDRQQLWADILLLLQRVVQRWATIPTGSDIRSIEFARFAYALLPADAARALERTILAKQGETAGLDDPLLDKLEDSQPPRPMTSQELFDLWWPGFGDYNRRSEDAPKDARTLGYILRNKAGRLGDWVIEAGRDPVRNITLWSFKRERYSGVLREEEAIELLRGLMEGREEWEPMPTADSSGDAAAASWNGSDDLSPAERVRPPEALALDFDGSTNGHATNGGGENGGHRYPDLPRVKSRPSRGPIPDDARDDDICSQCYRSEWRIVGRDRFCTACHPAGSTLSEGR